MRTLTLVSFVVLLLATSGCRKKSYKAFYEAERAYQVMVAREGEDAYFQPELEQVLTVLRAVPAGAPEEPKAQALLATIEQERARITAERNQAEAEARTAQAAAPPTRTDFGTTAPTEGAAPAIDPAAAGPGTPQPGMDEAEFKRQFGVCVTGPEVIELPTGKHPAYTGADDERCRKRLGTSAPTKFFFVNNKLAGRAISQVNAEAAAAADKARKEAEAAQANAKKEDFLFVPGAPLPKVLAEKMPPPNTGAMPAAPTGDGMKETAPPSTLPPRTE
ncbi:MAG: hypothetical protein MUC96_00975 [Myxococcaceae bacterium]|jgi:hypothetical protein|nr:hypothetical protein [Myxococcaceae bacterium]